MNKPRNLPYKLRDFSLRVNYSKMLSGGYTKGKGHLLDKFGRCCLFTFETLSIAADCLERLKNEVVATYNPN